jgi:SAM-dependent methyltransferase
VIQSATFEVQAASAAFDRMASSYDAVFTESAVGRAQRHVVWDALKRTFRAGQRVLELNCGTGVDALFLAGRGISVLACDASAGMIGVAERRKADRLPPVSAEFRVLRNEDLELLGDAGRFDGVLSNFSGLKTERCSCASRREFACGRSLGTARRPISGKPSGALVATQSRSWTGCLCRCGIRRSARCAGHFGRGSGYARFEPSVCSFRRLTLRVGREATREF